MCRERIFRPVDSRWRKGIRRWLCHSHVHLKVVVPLRSQDIISRHVWRTMLMKIKATDRLAKLTEGPHLGTGYF